MTISRKVYFGLIALTLALAPVDLSAQGRRGGFGGGPGGFGGFGGSRELIPEFDKDGDGILNAAERQAAREAQPEPGGGRFRGPGGRGGDNQRTPEPGVQVSRDEVATYEDRPIFDPLTLRTFFLDFENADWEAELEAFNNTDVEVPAALTVDGKTYEDVGVHFRGASSFGMVASGMKRSLNLSMDWIHDGQDIDGYNTFNLLNSHTDPSFLRTVLFYEIARSYIPAPKANFVRLVINGENWGIYINAQQHDKDFLKDVYGSKDGARWKVPGSPNGRGGLTYLGDDPEDYRGIYDIKSKDREEDWAAFIEMTRVLNETPPERLVEELSPLLDIDGALKFLALDIGLVNNDGYWVRASDYYIDRDSSGVFHITPHDGNETFAAPGGMGRGGPGGRRGPGGFGPGGPGGPGGFGGRPGGGPGGLLADPIFTEADRDADGRLTKTEMTRFAQAWSEEVGDDGSLEDFKTSLEAKAGIGGEGPGARFSPIEFLAPRLFEVLDADADGSLAGTEMVGQFEAWFGEWSGADSEDLSREDFSEGLGIALRPPGFAGRPGGAPGPRNGPPEGDAPRPRPGGGPQSEQAGMLDPLSIADDPSRALAHKLLAVPELRARYLESVRDLAATWLDWEKLGPIAQSYHDLIAEEVRRDTKKLDSTENFEKSLIEDVANSGGFGPRAVLSLKRFADERREYLLSHPEIAKLGSE